MRLGMGPLLRLIGMNDLRPKRNQIVKSASEKQSITRLTFHSSWAKMQRFRFEMELGSAFCTGEVLTMNLDKRFQKMSELKCKVCERSTLIGRENAANDLAVLGQNCEILSAHLRSHSNRGRTPRLIRNLSNDW